MGHKYEALLGFFYSALKDTSEEGLTVFRELLKDLKADEDDIKKAKIEDEGMKRALKDIGYSKKIRKALEEDEPPDHVKGYVDTFLSEVSGKAKAFFVEQKPEPKSYSIKDRFENAIEITALRSLFPKDRRILPSKSEEDVFKFELSCFYRKEQKHLSMNMSARFAVEEKEVQKISSQDLVLFDKFIEALGFAESFEKSVQFSATVCEGETFYDNTCEVNWTKTLEM